MKRKLWQPIVVVLVLALAGVGYMQRQAITDWEKLRGYTPSSNVVNLATYDTMTDKARHLLYVNKPAVITGQAFASKCGQTTEKTIVLGCYLPPDTGIYVLSVSDPTLNGVEQVTAAHEMLHAAYRRLSSSERSKVNTMLLDYYNHGLTDQRIKDTIAAYKTSEPGQEVNEMHSIFGTEIANLPAPLEQYYKQYFTNRATVAAYAAQYQNAFTTRRAQVASYDTQLASIKQQIDANTASVQAQSAQLSAERPTLAASGTPDQIAAYNAQVGQYNALLTDTKTLIDQYNGMVTTRNQVAAEIDALTKELSGSSLPSAQ